MKRQNIFFKRKLEEEMQKEFWKKIVKRFQFFEGPCIHQIITSERTTRRLSNESGHISQWNRFDCRNKQLATTPILQLNLKLQNWTNNEIRGVTTARLPQYHIYLIK